MHAVALVSTNQKPCANIALAAVPSAAVLIAGIIAGAVFHKGHNGVGVPFLKDPFYKPQFTVKAIGIHRGTGVCSAGYGRPPSRRE